MELIFLEGFPPKVKPASTIQACTCKTTESKYVSCTLDVSAYPRHMGQQNVMIYNACIREPMAGAKGQIDKDSKDCKCFPTEPPPACNAFDCDCLVRDREACSRIKHKSFCPSFKHKETCPVSHMHDEESEAQPPVQEEETTPLPYGLPPLKFGPCPVPGRPCSGAEGMARLLKNIPQPPPPPPNPIIGKITCSKEYERIRKALLDFQQEEKKPDFKCINKFNVDTEKRCCDKEQKLLNLLGKSCCAEHKLAAMALYKEKQEREASERRNAQPPS